MNLIKSLFLAVTITGALAASANDAVNVSLILNSKILQGDSGDFQSINLLSKEKSGSTITSKYSIVDRQCNYVVSVVESCSQTTCSSKLLSKTMKCIQNPVKGELIEFKNGNINFANKNITREEAYDNCKSDSSKLPNAKIYCTFNGELIFGVMPKIDIESKK